MSSLKDAPWAWRELLAQEHVIADEASLKAVQTATFASQLFPTLLVRH